VFYIIAIMFLLAIVAQAVLNIIALSPIQEPVKIFLTSVASTAAFALIALANLSLKMSAYLHFRK